MRRDVAVLEEELDGRVADEDQADAGGEAFEQRGLDAACAGRDLKLVAVLVQGVGAEAGEDGGGQGDGEDAERELVEELGPVQAGGGADLHRVADRVAEEGEVVDQVAAASVPLASSSEMPLSISTESLQHAGPQGHGDGHREHLLDRRRPEVRAPSAGGSRPPGATGSRISTCNTPATRTKRLSQ